MKKMKALLVAMTCALGGCAFAPQGDPQTEAATRPELTVLPDQESAVVVGQQTGSSLFTATVSILAVDGIATTSPAQTALTPLRISPGHHRLRVVQRWGDFHGATELEFDAKAGQAYKVRAAQDAPWYAKTIYGTGGMTAFWVEQYRDAYVVSEKSLVNVRMDRDPADFPLPVKK